MVESRQKLTDTQAEVQVLNQSVHEAEWKVKVVEAEMKGMKRASAGTTASPAKKVKMSQPQQVAMPFQPMQMFPPQSTQQFQPQSTTIQC